MKLLHFECDEITDFSYEKSLVIRISPDYLTDHFRQVKRYSQSNAGNAILLIQELKPPPLGETVSIQENGASGEELKGLKILVVDDIADNQTLLSRRLQRCGATVEIAENGLEGVTMALLKPYDLILMDLQMPIVDGLTATKHLRKYGFDRPIVACTAHTDERENALRRFGFDDFFCKPLDLTALIHRLRRIQIMNTLRGVESH